MNDRQLLRVLAVGLDPFAGLARDHRWYSHTALVPQCRELAMDAIPASACFIAEVKLRAWQAASPP
jgi:hypothetical protein